VAHSARRQRRAVSDRVMDKHYITGPDPLCVVLALHGSYRCNIIFGNGASDVILAVRNASITQTRAAPALHVIIYVYTIYTCTYYKHAPSICINQHSI